MATEQAKDLPHRPKAADIPKHVNKKVNFDGNTKDDSMTQHSNNEEGGEGQVPENDDAEPADQGVVATDLADLPAPKKKKKKSHKKPASKRGWGKPTGMEEFFADAPMTPAEYEETKQLYDPEISFLDRILTAIQRFERTRKLTAERRNIFYKWLHYGGIIVGQNQFSGAQIQEDMDKDQITTALSRVSIPDDVREALETTDSEEPKYAIDFMGCMQGFLSRLAPMVLPFENRESVQLVTSTCERFLDYLMQHEVCPEYKDDILATRNFCREAHLEMWSVSEAQRWLPGDFNIACSTLFGGNYGRNYDGETYWGDIKEGDAVFVGFTPEKATQLVGFGIAGAAPEDVYKKYYELTEGATKDGLEVVKVFENQGFEIVDMEDPTADCIDLYKNNSDDFRPVGRVIAKPWKNPEAPAEDLTDEEKELVEGQQKDNTERYLLLVEGVIIRNLSVGQKVLATIRQLNCGIWFFDEFLQILPDFELFLMNDLMEDYKRPKMLKDAYCPGWVDVNEGMRLVEKGQETEGDQEGSINGHTASEAQQINGDEFNGKDTTNMCEEAY